MAGQTRFPTFSMKKTSSSRQGKSCSDLCTSSASRWQACPVVMAFDGMPASWRRRASLSVARSAETAPRRRPFIARAVASSTAVFPEPGEPMMFKASTPDSRKCSRLCAAVRSLPARIFSCSSTGTSSVSPQPQVVHIYGTSMSIDSSSRASLFSSSRAGRSQRAHRSTSPRAKVLPQPGQVQAAAKVVTSSDVCSQRVPARKVSKAVRNSSGSTPASSPMLTRSPWIASAFRRRASSSTRRTRASTSEYSCIARPVCPTHPGRRARAPDPRSKEHLLPLELRRPLLEEGRDALGEVGAVGDAGELIELLAELPVEAVDRARLVEELLRDGEGARRAGGEAPRERHHLRVEALRRIDLVHEPPVARRPRVEARVHEGELERAPEPHQARQEEGRALGAGERGLPVGPLEDGALGGDDEVARHRDAEPARRGDAVHRADDGLGRALHLGDGRVDVLEDLL